MARYDFGGTLADFVVTSRRLGGLDVLGLSSATLTFWSAQTGGTRYTDLQLNGSATSSITVGADGQVPKFQGPDAVTEMWADGGSARIRIVTLQGAPGPTGKDGSNGLPGVNAVANDTATASQISTTGSATDAALQAAYAVLPNAAEKTLYVSTNGNDAKPGTTPGGAKKTIGAALTALGTSAGVIHVGAGTFSFSTTLALTTGQRIMGAGKNGTVLSYTGTGSAIAQTSIGTGTRRFGFGLAHFSLNTTTGAIAVDLDSVSSSTFEHINVTGFSSMGFFLHSITNGGSVYNRFYDVTVSSTPTGYRLENGSNATMFRDCRSNVCTVRGWDIFETNDCLIDGCQAEAGGASSVGFFVDAGSTNLASWNRFRSIRSEVNNVGVQINSANVANTVIDGMWSDGSTTTPIVDNSTTTRRASLLLQARTANSILALDAGWSLSSGASVNLGTTSSAVAAATNAPLYLRGNASASGSTQVGAWIGNGNTLATAGQKVVGFCADQPVLHASPVAYVNIDGSYEFANGVKVMAGAGIPTAAAPNGSTYQRTDGAAGSTLYVRVAGAWVAADGGSAGGAAPGDPGTTTYIRKATDTTRNNTITLAADPELTAAVVAGGVYELDSLLIYSASTTGDMLLGWTGPAGSSLDWAMDGLSVATTGIVGQIGRGRTTLAGSLPLGGAAAGTGGKVVAKPTGILIAGASGNLTLTWAQNTQEATDATIYTQSFIKLTRIA